MSKTIPILTLMMLAFASCGGSDDPRPPTSTDADVTAPKIPDTDAAGIALPAFPDSGVKVPQAPSTLTVTLDCLCADTVIYPFCAAVSCQSRRASDDACDHVCKNMGARTGVAMTCRRGCA